MKIYVKNMFSQRAISLLKEELDRRNMRYKSIEVGEINFKDEISLKEIYNLDLALYQCNLSLIFNNTKIVTDIRNVILDMVSQCVGPETNIAAQLTGKLGYNYAYLNMYFTLETGLSIEKYYNEKSVEKMSYSNPQHQY